MKRISVFACLLLLLSGFHSLWAWGAEGHEVIADIAQTMLSPNTLTALDNLRKQNAGNYNDLKTDEPPPYTYIDTDLQEFLTGNQLTLSLIANWPDGWDHKTSDAAATATYDWHFVDIPVNNSATDDAVSQACLNQDCVIDQLQNEAAILKDTTASQEDRIKALFFVVHFCGDIQQPLHCSTEFDDTSGNPAPTGVSDKGGNLKRIEFFGKKGKNELHALWDTYYISKHNPKELGYASELETAISQIEPSTLVAWRNLDIKGWALESHAVAVSIYSDFHAKADSGQTPPDYEQADQDKWIPVVDQQLEKAGVRLAYMLNNALGGGLGVSSGTASTGSSESDNSTPANGSSSSSNQVKVIKVTAKVYSKASSKSTVLKTVNQGDILDLGNPPKSGRYFHVTVDGQDGYIYGTNVSPQTGGSSESTAPARVMVSSAAMMKKKSSSASGEIVPVSDPNGVYEHFPNHDWTPGMAGNPLYDQEALCTHTKSTSEIRSVTTATKKQVFQEYGIDYSEHSKYEVDHFVPLCLSGQNDIKNLWPQPYDVSDGLGARQKDKVEVDLFKKVCSGQLALDQAVSIIETNWVEYYENTIASDPKTDSTIANDDN